LLFLNSNQVLNYLRRVVDIVPKYVDLDRISPPELLGVIPTSIGLEYYGKLPIQQLAAASIDKMRTL